MLLGDARNDSRSKKADLRMPGGMRYQKRKAFWASEEEKEWDPKASKGAPVAKNKGQSRPWGME